MSERFQGSVTAVTWLPLAALDALPRLPLGLAVAHHDEPPPPALEDLDALRKADAFREANELRAWIDVEQGRVVDFGMEGRTLAPAQGLELGAEELAFPTVELPAIRPDPEAADGWVRFTQTAGGRLGLPVPRPLRGETRFHLGTAVAWTTVELVLHVDGRVESRLLAASPFPRHAVYDSNRRLSAEVGLTDFDGWFRDSFGDETPWGSSEAVLADALEARLEAELSRVIARETHALARRRLEPGEALVQQGQPGGDMYLLLDGVLTVEVDGEAVAEVGSGALLGDLARLGDGRRTATLRAARASRVAVLPTESIGPSPLDRLARSQRERLRV